MNRIVLVMLTVSASVAHAEGEPTDEPTGDPGRYAAVGGITGEDRFEYGGIAGELGVRIPGTVLFGRVMAQAGNTGLAKLAGRGTYMEGRGGVEARTCIANGMMCGSLGLDVGIHRSHFEHADQSGSPGFQKPQGPDVEVSSDERFDSVVWAPRLTLDGGARVRVRGVLELPNHVRSGGSVTGYAVSLGLGVAF